MLTTITQISQALQRILGQEADALGRSSGFIQRQGKLTGSSFVQALVFGFASKPAASYSQLSQSTATVGTPVSPQALEQRFTRQSAALLQQVLTQMVATVVTLDRPSTIALLARFAGVWFRDNSVVRLPASLGEVWQGNGGPAGANAAVKLQVDFNYASGQLKGPLLADGRSQDQASPYQRELLPAGSLHVGDLGFFSLQRFAWDDQHQVYWLSRLKTGTVVQWTDGTRFDLLHWLQQQTASELDVPILLGAYQRLPCRLLVQRVPQEVAEQRRRKLREAARVQQKTVSAERLALCAWTLVVTNVPVAKLSGREALVLLRLRWQVELLFKLWKSHNLIDEWRSEKPWRILTELYAKLIVVVLEQWLFQASLWDFPQRSLFRAVQTIQEFMLTLAINFAVLPDLLKTLERLVACLQSNCRLEKRKKFPAAFQLLLAFEEVVAPLA